MAQLIALFLAGLSLFFYGVGGVKTNLQGLTSRRLRKQLARWAEHPVLAGLWGFVFGAITQSSTAVTFILTSLVSGGLMTVARALPIVAWANLGTVVLVVFASFNIHLAFLYLLGVTGLMLAFNLGSTRIRPLLATFFSIGLLFYGLQLMKEAFAPLPQFSWFNDLATFLQGSALATFVVGALLRVLLQSSSGIAVITIALAHGGLISADQAVMMMYGTGVGVGLSVYLLSSNLQGMARQLALYQALINTFSGVVLCTLYYVETLAHVPLVLQFTRSVAHTPGLQLAGAFVALQSTSVIVALAFSRSAVRWLAKISPPTAEQDLARPHFINAQALADPESALDLAEKEQLRILGHLPAQLDTVRTETAGTAAISADVLHRAGIAVGVEVQAYLRELIDQPSDRATAERLLALEQRQTTLTALNETVRDFTATFGKLSAEGTPVSPFLDNLVESLHTLLLTALDALQSGDPSDRELFMGMTSDRGNLMERLRRNLVQGTQPIDHQQKAHLLYLTSLFERTVWLLRQLAQSQPGATMR